MEQIVTVPTPEMIVEPLVFHEEELTESTLPGKFVTILSVVDISLIFVIILTLALIKDRKINQERHPIFLPFRPPRGFRLYAVLIETGQSPAGGTSAKVFLRIIGKLTKTPGFTLICTTRQRRYGSKHLFGSQNKDIFILSVPHYLGGIESFEVMTDRRGDSPPWFLKSIRVMSLNNSKCWKSDVSAWLRGDKKPYSIKASLIGALSTKEYFLKTFLQTHLWTAPWYRILGSSLMSGHRAMILWISVGCSIWINHYFLYDEKLKENIRQNKVVTEQYTVHDVARAACLSSMGGVLSAMIIRQILVLLTGGSKWQRLDDKDDLCHLMKPKALEYAYGAVVPRITMKSVGEYVSLTDLEHLTQEQRRAIKHITECKISDCSLKKIINEPVCASHKACCYSRDKANAYTPNTTFQQAFQQPFDSAPQHPFDSAQQHPFYSAPQQPKEEFIQPRVSVPLEKGEGTAGNASCCYTGNQTRFSPDFADLCDCEPRLVCSEDIRKCPLDNDRLDCCIDLKPSCGGNNPSKSSKESRKNKSSGKTNDKKQNKSKRSKTGQKTCTETPYGIPNYENNSIIAHNAYNTPYSSAQTSLTEEKARKSKKGFAPHVSARKPPKNKNIKTKNEHNIKIQNTVSTAVSQIRPASTNKLNTTNKFKCGLNKGSDQGPTKTEKLKFKSQDKHSVPFVSARMESSSSDLFVDALTDHEQYRRKQSLGDHFDSVSEAESDQEIVTKSARTDSEINLIKRPAHVYSTAPQWHDKYHIWTEAVNGGSQHHLRLNKRYDFAIGSADISTSNQLSKLERSIHNYLLEEQNIPAGSVNLSNTILASLLATLLALGALFISCYAAYERLFISNGDTLIFLYALVFSLLLNLLLFSTVAAVAFSLLATYQRRNKILLRREKNALSY